MSALRDAATASNLQTMKMKNKDMFKRVANIEGIVLKSVLLMVSLSVNMELLAMTMELFEESVILQMVRRVQGSSMTLWSSSSLYEMPFFGFFSVFFTT